MKINTNRKMAKKLKTTKRQISKGRNGRGSLSIKVKKALIGWGKKVKTNHLLNPGRFGVWFA